MKIRQIDFTEAMELTRSGKKVFVITDPEKPSIKQFKKLAIGEALCDNGKYIFVVFEE